MKLLPKLALLTLLLALFLTLVQPGTVYASDQAVPTIASQNRRELYDQVVFGDTYTLRNGDTLVGDLIILGGSVTLEEGSIVDGSVVLVGGSLDIQGTIQKDLVVVGGSPNLGDMGSIQGDAITIGSSLSGNSQGVVGDIITDSGNFFHIRTIDGRLPTVGVASAPVLWGVLGLLFSVFSMTALAIGMVLILPKQTERTAKVLIRQPLASGGMGCLTMIMAPIILLVMAITLFLLPFSVLGGLVLILLVIFGWVALGMELGNQLGHVLHHDWHPAVAAGIGTFGLTFVALSITKIVTFVGWMIPLLVSMVALGAVMLVFFGAGSVNPPTRAISPTKLQPIPVDASNQIAPSAIETSSSPNPPDDGIPPAI